MSAETAIDLAKRPRRADVAHLPQRFAWFHAVTLFCTACILSQGFLPVGRFAGVVEVLDPGVRDPWANTLQAFVLSLMLTSVIMQWRRVQSILIYNIPAIVVFTFCLSSVIWSIDPGTTIRRSVLLLADFVFGPFAFAAAGVRGTVRSLNQASWFMIIASLFLYVAAPAVGRDIGDYAGALRGVFVQKNVTAWAFELALTYLGYSMYADRKISARLVFGSLFIVFCIALTKSTTEVVSSAVLFAFWGFSFWYREAKVKALPLWTAASLGALGLIAVLSLGDQVYALIGKDSTLTGRAEIWQAVHMYISQRPLLGWGYAAFWTPDNPAAQQLWAWIDWHAPHAHNGILEVLIEVGYIALALCGAWGAYLLFLIGSGLRRDSATAWWSLSWFIMMVMKAQTEAMYLQIDMAMSLLAFSTVALAVERRDALQELRRAKALDRSPLHVVLSEHRSPGFAIPAK